MTLLPFKHFEELFSWSWQLRRQRRSTHIGRSLVITRHYPSLPWPSHKRSQSERNLVKSGEIHTSNTCGEWKLVMAKAALVGNNMSKQRRHIIAFYLPTFSFVYKCVMFVQKCISYVLLKREESPDSSLFEKRPRVLLL
jgi:hypothetical protein